MDDAPKDGIDARADTPGTGPHGEGRQPPSQARIDANRRNAQHSTGPRTTAGKDRSAQNALKHGGYAQFVVPISSGSLAEDAEWLSRRMAMLAVDLNPRDAVEERQAQEIAALYLKLDRLDRYEGLALEAAGRTDAAERELLGDEDRHHREFLTSHEVDAALEPDPEDHFDYGRLTSFLSRHAQADEALISQRGAWQKEPAPSPGEEEAEFRRIIAHYWPDGQLSDWLGPIRVQHLAAHAASRGRQAEVAGRRALATLDGTIKLRAMVGAQLLRAVAIFLAYQEHPLRRREAEDR